MRLGRAAVACYAKLCDWEGEMRGIFPAIIGLFLMSASQAHAGYGFAGSRADWGQMTTDQKYGYVMGSFDAMNLIDTDDTTSTRNTKAGRIRCVSDLRVTSRDLVRIIDAAYERDVSKWTYPPSAVLMGELYSMCKTVIDNTNLGPATPVQPKR